MSDHYFLYTVTGGHEVYYAAVDRDTDRVWTGPTKEVAHRQAREAGLRNFTEGVISREDLLHLLGIDDDSMRIHPEKPEIRSEPKTRRSETSWFVGGHGTEQEAPGMGSLPKLHSGRGRSRNLKKGKSPFTGKPIAPPADDMLVMPSSEHPPTDPKVFTDKPKESNGEEI